MSIRGQRKLLLALWAVLGTCLGSAGCQVTFGPAGSAAASNNGSGCSTCQSPQPVSKPHGAVHPAALAQVAHTGPLEEMPPPAAGGPAPLAPGQAPHLGGVVPHGAPLMAHDGPVHEPGPLPVELTPTSHPPYTVAPPDILYIDTLRLIPRPPYRIEALDQLQILVTDTLPNQPVAGVYTVMPDGTVNLGFAYGSIRVGGLTVDQAQAEIRKHLGSILRNPQVSVSLVNFRAMQLTRGEHLVRPDGTIGLGTYGSLYVAGMTLGQVKCLLESHLAKYFLDPLVSVDVAAYNSKFYYVITDGGGFGQAIYKFPVTGNEYVLDAIANIQGLPPVASKRRIWVARPAPCNHGCYQILPVDWRAITEGGQTCTNYQLLPGDRVFVHADKLIALDNWLSKILAPIERLFGITLLGSSTVQSITNPNFGSGTAGFVTVVP